MGSATGFEPATPIRGIGDFLVHALHDDGADTRSRTEDLRDTKALL